MRSPKVTMYALIVALSLSMAAPALAQGEPDPEFTTALGMYYKQQWVEAQDAFTRVAEKNPRDTMAWWYLIHTYYKRNDLHSILYRVEQRAVASEGKDAVALAHLGLGYMVRSMREPALLDEAQKTFEKALAIDENLSIAHCGQGLVFYQRRMMPRAKSHFLSALRANPNDLMANERVGEIVMDDEHNATQAQPFFDTITRLAPHLSGRLVVHRVGPLRSQGVGPLHSDHAEGDGARSQRVHPGLPRSHAHGQVLHEAQGLPEGGASLPDRAAHEPEQPGSAVLPRAGQEPASPGPGLPPQDPDSQEEVGAPARDRVKEPRPHHRTRLFSFQRSGGNPVTPYGSRPAEIR